jgi:hypothetical protein
MLRLPLLLLPVRITDSGALARRVPPENTALLARLLFDIVKRHMQGSIVTVALVATQ